jgi:hypothetical protein
MDCVWDYGCFRRLIFELWCWLDCVRDYLRWIRFGIIVFGIISDGFGFGIISDGLCL